MPLVYHECYNTRSSGAGYYGLPSNARSGAAGEKRGRFYTPAFSQQLHCFVRRGRTLFWAPVSSFFCLGSAGVLGDYFCVSTPVARGHRPGRWSPLPARLPSAAVSPPRQRYALLNCVRCHRTCGWRQYGHPACADWHAWYSPTDVSHPERSSPPLAGPRCPGGCWLPAIRCPY
jgi:hypothetical protein